MDDRRGIFNPAGTQAFRAAGGDHSAWPAALFPEKAIDYEFFF